MPDASGKARICLSMIVKNESHIVHEAIEAVAPYIDYWVIVDTGSDDGTQDVIRTLMAERGIPGELHERPWVDFGHNRTEANQLAQGHGDYILLMDADDTIVGTLDFRNLTADCYWLRIDRTSIFWRPHLFKDGVNWRWEGAVHERAVCDAPHTGERLEGDYRLVSRSLGARSRDPNVFRKDCEILLASVQKSPNVQSVYHLAQSYADAGDFADARHWWERLLQMDAKPEIHYFTMFRIADAMDNQGEPWSEVQDAYLRAWEFRPTRAEALSRVAFHYLDAGRYFLGHFFATRAAQIPLPEDDSFFVIGDVYRWRAADEQAVCASWIPGHQGEALAIWRRLLKLEDLPDRDRERMLGNRDLMAAHLLQVCAEFPEELALPQSGGPDPTVTLSVAAEPDRAATEATLNSFLRCCTDRDRVGRFVVLDSGLTPEDRAELVQRYPFAEIISSEGEAARSLIGGRYWLHLAGGWRFFTEERLISRLIGILEAEPDISRVAINLGDATGLGPECPARAGVRTTSDGNGYVLADGSPLGPAMVDLTRPEGGAATLDEVLCVRV